MTIKSASIPVVVVCHEAFSASLTYLGEVFYTETLGVQICRQAGGVIANGCYVLEGLV